MSLVLELFVYLVVEILIFGGIGALQEWRDERRDLKSLERTWQLNRDESFDPYRY